MLSIPADYEDYLIVLREYVSRKAAGKGKAVLEGVGLDAHVINACFCDNPGCEEEAVHTGLQKWILEGQGSQPATWEVLLDAMKHAFIGIPHIQSLRKLLGLPKVHTNRMWLACMCNVIVTALFRLMVVEGCMHAMHIISFLFSCMFILQE